MRSNSNSNAILAGLALEANFGESSTDSAKLELEAERIARELKLPPCPSVLDAFYREMNDDDADIRKLAALVNADLALSAAVLKTVNSPAYGLARATTNVQQALSIIGLRATANLISRLLFRQAFPETKGGMMQVYWQETATLTEAAPDVARAIPGMNVDDAMTYLVFRDCGAAVMLNRYDDYAPHWRAHQSGNAFTALQSEMRQYQTNHAHVGYAMAREWRLPETMLTAILCHHDVARPLANPNQPRQLKGAPVRLAAFGLLMDQIIASRHNVGVDVTDDWKVVEPFVLSELKLTPDQVVSMISNETRH
jgi:HD-like signal output (HDOD) protein